jgi:alpha-glucosidase
MQAQTDQVIQPGAVKSLKKIEHGILVKTENVYLMVLVYQPQVLRIRLSQSPFPDDFSYAVIRKPEGNFTTVRESANDWQLVTDSLKIILTKNPLSLQILNLKDQVLCEDYQAFSYTWQGTEVTSYKKLFPDEKFVGLGEKTGNVNHRGEKFENRNSDVPAYANNADPLYQTIPFYMGIHDKVVYGIFLDNSFRTKFNLGASTDEQYAFFSAVNGEMNYYIFGASAITGIIRDYTWLTGRMPMPPLWSIGYQQCRWSYFPDSEVLRLANTFRDKKIPCDVIYLDIDYMDSYKIFTWNNMKFPRPQDMIGKLKDQGFHLVTIVDPGIKIEKGYFAYDEGLKNGYFARYPHGEFYTGSVWPGRCHFPDFTNEAVRQWWGNSFSRLVEPGVEGFWNDMNEPSAWGQSIPNIVRFDFDGRKASMAEAHNIYGLEMSRATFEGTRKLMNGKRPFILTRAGFAGIQRYSAVWTGDNVATDEHMLLSARMVNTMGLSGISFAGPDMGGFIGNPSQELFQRWLSQGVYTPFFRNHSAWGTNHKEPWSFGEDVEKFSREQINQRYRLIPYIYSMFYQSTITGLPVARSLTIDYTFNEKAYWYEYQTEYLFGDNLLVAPVSCIQNAAKVYLPPGGWYRLTTGANYAGDEEITVDAPLSDLPVFVKAGGIIPMQSVVQSTSQKPSPILELHVYMGEHPNNFLYYEDDGITYQFEKGDFYKRLITYDPVKKFISLGKVEGSFPSRFTRIYLILHSFGEILNIEANGKAYSLKLKSPRERTAEIPLTNDEMIIKIITQ